MDDTREPIIGHVISMEGEKKDIPVEVAMIYNTSYSENLHSYVNNINTHEGGTHLSGFRRGLTNTLKKYADFTGRARRTEYWMYILIYMIINIVLAVLGLDFISMIFGLGLLIPSLSIGARRLHDTGRSGWWQLIYFVPLIGLIVMIVFLVQDSHDENDYGANPKLDVSE